jgi:hypothetical protein
MIRTNGYAYLKLGQDLESLRLVFYMAGQLEQGHPGRDLTPDEKQHLADSLGATLSMCQDLDLSVSRGLLATATNDPPQTQRELDMLIQAVVSELKTKVFFYVPSYRANFHQSNWIPPDSVERALPNAAKEMKEAGNCYAYGQSTACVLHAMRAAEVGLWSLARRLRVKLSYPIELAQWLTLIEHIESKIKALGPSLSKGKAKDEKLAFYADAAVHFLCFKDAWRSRAAHARATFNEDAAYSILNHTREFFVALSKRLKE